MSLIERVSKKAEILDDLCGIIPLEIESNKEKREDWLSWHSEWKKAWIDKDSNLSTEELEQKRILTSVTTKYPVIE